MDKGKYIAKTKEEWHQNIIKQMLPDGDWCRSAFIPGAVHYKIYEAISIIFSQLDKQIEKTINGFKLDNNCLYLDEWYDNLRLNRFIDRLDNKEIMASLAKFFLRAKRGVFTDKDIEELIKNIFNIDIKVKIYSRVEFQGNVLATTLSFVLFSDNNDEINDYSVIIAISDSSLNPYDRNDFIKAVKGLLEYIIPINYSFYFTNDFA